ncbi:helix-turn-helix domain-containing protein [Agarilytica rhodophyticola]|uniref:helix-turn-helix domain-containing protein n=1 Tax=Agarilytica rhodophyticola TaxID=1737490 RepID=UPI000B342867|nr:helix-turn-helix domain-containing protein [Agarilytica rhodophyticola]
MKINTSKVKGVLHQSKSAQNYRLRRYFPDALLAGFVEQFWFVDWQLPEDRPHIQKNLPDLNFHLLFNEGKLSILGPVSKAYSYKMVNSGSIVGVKFELGALTPLLNSKPADYIDRQLRIEDVFGGDIPELIEGLVSANNDQELVQALQRYLMPFTSTPLPSMLRARELVNTIKNDIYIAKVDALSSRAGLSVRAIQRCLKEHLGVSPKWLIRKYRLHRALEMLDDEGADIADVVTWLDYTDQSHLIRDFNEIIGITPKSYIDGKS